MRKRSTPGCAPRSPSCRAACRRRRSADVSTWSALVERWHERADPAVITADGSWSGTELIERAGGAAVHLQSVARHTGAIPALLTSSPTAFAYVIGGARCGRPIAPLGPRLT